MVSVLFADGSLIRKLAQPLSYCLGERALRSVPVSDIQESKDVHGSSRVGAS